MKRNIRFRKMWNSFVTLTIWEMESPVISWIFTVPEIMKENFQSCLTCARKPYWSPDPDYSPCTRMQSLYTVKNTIFLKS